MGSTVNLTHFNQIQPIKQLLTTFILRYVYIQLSEDLLFMHTKQYSGFYVKHKQQAYILWDAILFSIHKAIFQ